MDSNKDFQFYLVFQKFFGCDVFRKNIHDIYGLIESFLRLAVRIYLG